jgi:hypothetical protein
VITVQRYVYYCEHCKRHRLSKASIEKHEPKFIYNPLRLRCGWHETPPSAPADFAPILKQELDVDWLRTTMEGCPACMLAVVVQAGLTFYEREELGFDYKREVERFREEERRDYYGF